MSNTQDLFLNKVSDVSLPPSGTNEGFSPLILQHILPQPQQNAHSSYKTQGPSLQEYTLPLQQTEERGQLPYSNTSSPSPWAPVVLVRCLRRSHCETTFFLTASARVTSVCTKNSDIAPPDRTSSVKQVLGVQSTTLMYMAVENGGFWGVF